MKPLILSILIYFIFLNYNCVFSQEDVSGGDVFVTNSTSKTIWVRVYPISMVFNVDFITDIGNYDFHAMESNSNFDYINGKGIGDNTLYVYGKHKLLVNETKSWNMEGVTTAGESVAGIGRGIYRFEFFYETINNLVDSAIVE